MSNRFYFVLIALFLLIIGMFFSFRYRSYSFSLNNLNQVENLVSIAVIGSGPAGLSAALYGARLGLYTIVFDGPKPGGQLTETGDVENWPGVGRKSGPAIMKDQREYVEKFGVSIVPDGIKSVDFSQWPYRLTTDENIAIYALSVIIATGSAPSVLAIPGEREYWGKGVTTCAVCDAPYYKDKEVIVVGGGDSAIEEVVQLSSYAKKVVLVVRKEFLRASAVMQKRLQDIPSVTILYNSELKEILGDGNHVTEVLIYDNKQKSYYKRATNGVFLAIGHEPRTKILNNQISLDKYGYIKLQKRSQETSLQGIFAAGDVADPVYRQAGVAAGEGIKAALDAQRFLQKIGWSTIKQESFKSHFYEPEKAGESFIKEISSESEFEKLVLNADKPSILDFYAQHCPSCMHMLPIYELVARRFRNSINFFKINTVKSPELEERLHVQRIPCFIVFKEGQQVARYFSIMNKPQMVEFVQQFVV